jgi:hypothetical protein
MRHHFIVDLIDDKVSRPYKYGATAGVSDSSARHCDACLPATVHMEYFSNIVLTKSAERPHREVLAPERKFSETFATCR